MIKYIFLLSFLITLSQETPKFLQEPYEARQSFGIYANAGLNFHLTNSWETLPSVAGCCDGYGDISGLGYNFGLFYDVPLGSTFELDFRFNYSDLSGDITQSQKPSNPVFDPANNTVVGSRSEFSIKSTINAFTFEPGLNLKLTPQFRIRAGLFAGLFLTKDVVEQEEIISPNFGAYINENGERFRVVERYNGEIPEAPGTNFGLQFGASYDLPLNKNRTWFFVPEARYAMSFVSLHANETWTTNQFTGGFALRYAPRKVAPPKKAPPLPPPPPPSPLPPPPPVAPTIDAVINAYAIDEFGNENEMAVMKVEEFLEANTHPLLTYIFFEENSADIPPRYKKMKNEDTKNFAYSQYYGQTTIEVYYDVLNILGKRLQFYPQAELTLIGCNSNLGGEKGNTTLSKNRAEAIKNYLVDVWDIEANRLIVEARNLPSSPSNSKIEDGIQENRRVEIIPNFDRVVEPVVTTNTTLTTNPPNLRFKPEAKTEIGAESWKVTASQNGTTLRVFTGNGELPKQIDWNLASDKEQRNIPKFDQPIEYQLQIVDNDGKVWTSEIQQLAVDVLTVQEKIFEKQDDIEIDKYSMIGFGYNSSKLSAINLDMAETAKNRVYYESVIDITGHSDRTGNAKDNKDLSEKRAFTTADYIEVDRKFAKGFGDTILLFDNDLPEGRFYSRTVKIRIINTIEGF